MEKSHQNHFKPNYDRYDSCKDFNSLNAWKKCQEVKLYFYRTIIPKIPSEEIYNLGLQIRKASISVTANIAEGYGRYHFREALQYYRVARASLYELKDHLISCLELGFISSDDFKIALNLIESAKTTLNGFIKFVRNKISLR